MVEALIHQALAALEAGQLLVLPSASGCHLIAHTRRPASVPLLQQIEQMTPGGEWSLALYGVDDALAWVPDLTPLEARLLRRCWPGPLTLQLDAPRTQALTGQFAETVGKLAGDTLQGVRTPAHSVLLALLHQLDTPLLLLRLPTVPPGAAGIALTLPEETLLEPDTVVRVDNEEWQIVQPGAVATEQLQLQSICVILFVCTGNTCRSPLAEALCKKRLAEQLGCLPDELPRHGYLVLSAGLAAYRGDTAAPAAIEVAREWGADLEAHVSQPLDATLVSQADYLVCMTRGHLQLLHSAAPPLSCAPRLLRADNEDIADPVGQDIEVYRACAREMDGEMERFLQSVLSAARPAQRAPGAG